MFRKSTVRFQDASHGYNKDAGCFASKNDKGSGCFRMFHKVTIRFQGASQGYNKVSGRFERLP